MRIDSPTWVVIDHATYRSISLSLATARGLDLLEGDPTLTMRALEANPALLHQLDRLMASMRFTGDWTARIWGVSPAPRFDA